MKVSQFICMCGNLGNLELPQRYQNDNGREALQDERVQKLLLCCNCILEETYCTNATDVQKATVVATDGRIDLSQLRLCRVLRLTDVGGQNVNYRFSVNSLFVDENGTYLLTYAKLPETLSWDSEIPLPSQITYLTFAYGVLSAYFLTIGDVETYRQWAVRYGDAMRNARAKSSSMSMPAGRWL